MKLSTYLLAFVLSVTVCFSKLLADENIHYDPSGIISKVSLELDSSVDDASFFAVGKKTVYRFVFAKQKLFSFSLKEGKLIGQTELADFFPNTKNLGVSKIAATSKGDLAIVVSGDSFNGDSFSEVLIVSPKLSEVRRHKLSNFGVFDMETDFEERLYYLGVRDLKIYIGWFDKQFKLELVSSNLLNAEQMFLLAQKEHSSALVENNANGIFRHQLINEAVHLEDTVADSDAIVPNEKGSFVGPTDLVRQIGEVKAIKNGFVVWKSANVLEIPALPGDLEKCELLFTGLSFYNSKGQLVDSNLDLSGINPYAYLVDTNGKDKLYLVGFEGGLAVVYTLKYRFKNEVGDH